jgi:DNA-directed RNA polymerase subunit RPC12/RpoP
VSVTVFVTEQARGRMPMNEDEELKRFAEQARKKLAGAPESLPEYSTEVPTEDIVSGPMLGVPEGEREGVYVHSFRCLSCGLHFMLFSWKADRHKASNVTCPECGQSGKFLHWRSTLSERMRMVAGPLTGRLDQIVEIYQICPWPRSKMLSDSTLSD